MKTLTLVEAEHYETGHEYLVETVHGGFYVCIYNGPYCEFDVIYSNQIVDQRILATVYELPRGEA